jgi:hypothetical protein
MVNSGNFITMRFTTIPEAEVVLTWLEPVIPHLYTGLEYGTMKARGYFDAERKDKARDLLPKDIDRDLAPELVRHHAKRYLQSVAADAQFKVEDLARNGLYITDFRNLEIRILKADDGGLPVPGSKRKEEYFKQFTMPVFEASILKLVALWDVDQLYNLQFPLKLACPKNGDLERALVSAHWYSAIPYSIPAQVADPNAGADDLDQVIKLKRRDVGSGGNDKKK